jgi:Lipocalin-like domain
MKHLNSLTITTVALLCLGVALPAGDAVAQQKTLKEQLVGAWTLVSSTTKLPDGTPAWGTNPKGLLIFTQNGHYSSQIVRSDLPKFASNSRAKGTPEENKAVVLGSISTFGTYTVDETKKTFTIKFEGSSYPNRVGTEQTRPFTIAGDELTVTNPATTVGGTSEAVYKRAK